MKLGLFQIDNTLDVVPVIAEKYNAKLIARVPCASDTGDVEKLNEFVLPLNVNTLWKGDKGRFLIPIDIEQYKADFRQGYYSKLTNIPYLTSVQNEAIPWGQGYTPEMMVRMVHFHSIMVGDNFVTHAGTAMPLHASITRAYLTEIGDTKRLSDFDAGWKAGGLWLSDDTKTALALKELALFKKAAIPNFKYTIHANARRSNVDLYPVMIEAIRHYIDCEIIFNEVGFNTTETAVVTDFMNMLKHHKITTVIGFNDARTWAIKWTDAMLHAFMAFA
jgi:hypothetical protein